jgi:signal transduction histidine kinase
MDILIEDMLSLASAGDAIGETETVELSTLVEACWNDVETASAAFDIEAGGFIQADKSRLQQLLEDLLRNAIEHGGDAITVTVGSGERLLRRR